ncbi:MAG TPA: hypothetical protein VK121_09095 [Pseudogracilibacillus sp.]|nr:hypothetical protein [Pseudogracilibacillus sp.]
MCNIDYINTISFLDNYDTSSNKNKRTLDLIIQECLFILNEPLKKSNIDTRKLDKYDQQFLILLLIYADRKNITIPDSFFLNKNYNKYIDELRNKYLIFSETFILIESEELIDLNDDELLSFLTNLLYKAEHESVIQYIQKNKLLLSGLLSYSCQSYMIQLVSTIILLFKFANISSNHYRDGIEFLKFQHRENGGFGYINPLDNNFTEDKIKEFYIINTLFSLLALKF